MKKILICSHWMEIGGAERALLGLLNSIDCSKYQVDLYLCRHTGEFMKFIPKEVNVLPEDPKAASIAIPIKETLKKRFCDIVLGRVIAKIKTRNYLSKNPMDLNNIGIEYSNKYTYKYVKQINKDVEYDLAISFLEPHYIAAYKTNAKKKIAWMHTDYRTLSVDVEEGYKIWNQFDYIAAISEECWRSFCEKYPLLENKLVLIENIINPQFIEQQSRCFDVGDEMADDGSIKLLSVGRFCTAKNFDNIPQICKCLLQSGLDVKWYLIGYGGCEKLIRDKIIEYGMENNVIILGKKENPYPYMANCDVYVQPSRYEGKAVSVREAQCLKKLVAITNYPTSASQITDGYDGVVLPMNNEKCAKALSDFIRNKSLHEKIYSNLSNMNLGNKDEVEKIYSIIES